MIKIDFPEPTNTEWQKWREKCDTARDKLVSDVENGKKPKITDLYKDSRMQKIYKSRQEPFYGKCAYCECDVLINQGGIEHWRPKGRVTSASNKLVKIKTKNGTVCTHPGYYWLAYEWQNLLLACGTCNGSLRVEVSGQSQLVGKGTRFPVKGFRAKKMGEESRERPLLINPVIEDPADHMKVDRDTGVMIEKTPRGKTCIDIFGLNIREALLVERSRYIRKTKWLIQFWLNQIKSGESPEEKEAMCELTEKVQRIKSGAIPYSAGCRVVLQEFSNKLGELFSCSDNE